MTAPLQFAFGIHLHQPVGNLDSVFESHLADVYRPILREFVAAGCAPVSLHVSGPLIDWLERHAPDFIDELGGHARDGRVELLAAGYDEPILAVLPHEDRIEQIARLRAKLMDRFGVDARGLWLTERIWEPNLPEDLARAGIEYVLVDDRHFLVAGIARDALHRPLLTESGGSRVTVFPIDERLRYLVPFRPPSELADYFRDLRSAGHPLAILADDGEKFGGWPGTRQWVYERGWLKEFLETLDSMRESGELELVTLATARAKTPAGGLAYLPSASYREMEGWALPPEAANRLTSLEKELGEARLAGPEGALIRGSHWRHFLVKYPESNRMHKKMLAVSRLSRDRGDPPEARRAIGRAQCNDAYWHGVFGGLYLPFLRAAIWTELARAEGLLRAGEGLGADVFDLDYDGHDDIWIHSSTLSMVIAPARGGAVEEWTDLESGRNLADTLTRREEAYHAEAVRLAETATSHAGGAGEPDGEAELRLTILPWYDREARAVFQERLLPAKVTEEGFQTGSYAVTRSWAASAGRADVKTDETGVTVEIKLDGLNKTIRAGSDGSITVDYQWTLCAGEEPPPAWFSTELSLSDEVTLDPGDAIVWRYPIETVAKSERGFDRTVQGTAVVLRWPVGLGTARVVVRA
ncbi:MAG: alpha-amylase/4-alpha-glucanotransferase domain-containing protein [Gemmatimonadota bacterium]